jgi:hypothetical protein
MRNKGGINKGVLINKTRNLGMKPNKGGRPPNDKSAKARISFVFKDKEFEEDRSLGVLILDI